MKYLVIVPAYNESQVIFRTLTNLKQTLKKSPKFDIVVVDDGSTDSTYKEAKKAKVTVLQHKLNRGLGGALSTGLEYAKRNHYNLAITFDADGQHDPKDIIRAIRPIEKNQADVVIGTRTRGKGHMPIDRSILNWSSNIFTWVLFGVWTTDSQSGFRAFSKNALQLIQIKTQQMEVSSEFFAEIKRNNLRLIEVPIKVIYTKYSRAKGQTNMNALNVFVKLLLRLAR